MFLQIIKQASPIKLIHLFYIAKKHNLPLRHLSRLPVVNIDNTASIRIDPTAEIDRSGFPHVTPNMGVRIQLNNYSQLIMNQSSRLHGGTAVLASGHGCIEIGRRSFVNANSLLFSGPGKIKIGSDCAISWEVSMLAHDAHILLPKKEMEVNRDGKEATGDIIIDNHCWICTRTTILKGVHLRDNVIVAAGSIVLKGEYGPNVLLAGNPARVIKKNITWRNLIPEEKNKL